MSFTLASCCSGEVREDRVLPQAAKHPGQLHVCFLWVLVGVSERGFKPLLGEPLNFRDVTTASSPAASGLAYRHYVASLSVPPTSPATTATAIAAATAAGACTDPEASSNPASHTSFSQAPCFQVPQYRFDAVGRSGTDVGKRFGDQILFRAHLENRVPIFIAHLVLDCGKDPYELKLPALEEWQQASALFDQFRIGGNGGNRPAKSGKSDAGVETDRANAAFEKIVLQRLEAVVGGEDGVQENAPLHKAKGEKARLFQERIEQIVTPAQHQGSARVVGGEHVDHLDDSLEGAPEAQSFHLQPLGIHHNPLTSTQAWNCNVRRLSDRCTWETYNGSNAAQTGTLAWRWSPCEGLKTTEVASERVQN